MEIYHSEREVVNLLRQVEALEPEEYDLFCMLHSIYTVYKSGMQSKEKCTEQKKIAFEIYRKSKGENNGKNPEQ